MELLCKVCDREMFENESEYEKYITTLRRKKYRCSYEKYTINNVKLDEFDKILSDYISHPNKKFDFYFFNPEFQIEFDNNFIANIGIDYHYNKDTKNIKIYLLHCIDSGKFGGYKFNNINQLFINTFCCMCNMTYENYIYQPMPSVERQINMIIAKNPQLIDALHRNKPHPLINKYFYTPF